MGKKRIGLVLSVGWLWAISLPFRLGYRPVATGFSPGLRNILAYELRRLWHRLYERERLVYHSVGLRALLSRMCHRL